MELNYNTQRSKIALTEYGRGVQEMIEHLKTEEDREKRNRMARTIFSVMVTLNPTIKEQENYEQTVWDHMYEIAGHDLDIDIDFPKPEEKDKDQGPEHLGYKEVLSKYRFYGRNLIDMIDGAKDMEDGELKSLYINYIASFMVNSSKNWNDEDLTPEQVVQHLADLSKGKLQIDPATIDLHSDTRRRKSSGNQQKSNRNKKKKNNNRRR